ncbi:MAG: cupredoxin domain-containing protein [Thaumarchaeota archaeon]|nr:cupredoxin domain-containing protein [Nitrososphaerota archaeon]
MKIREFVFVASSLFFLLLLLTIGFVQAKEGVVAIPMGAATDQSSPGYLPAEMTVVIGVNSTVTWFNDDTAPHTVTPSTVPASGNWSVGSGNMNHGQSYQFTFAAPGKYDYVCAYHAWMRGTVVVADSSTIPEFPVSSLALILFVAVIAAILMLPRLKQKVPVFQQIS